jgi:hypothetical protein
MTTNYTPANMTNAPGLLLNRTAGDIDIANPGLGLGLRRTIGNNGSSFNITLNTALGSYQNMTVSFATDGNGNGFRNVTLFYSINGGTSFVQGPSVVLTSALQQVTLPVPVGANNSPLLILALVFTGGISNGNDLQTTVDNIQVNGTIISSASTFSAAGGR